MPVGRGEAKNCQANFSVSRKYSVSAVKLARLSARTCQAELYHWPQSTCFVLIQSLRPFTRPFFSGPIYLYPYLYLRYPGTCSVLACSRRDSESLLCKILDPWQQRKDPDDGRCEPKSVVNLWTHRTFLNLAPRWSALRHSLQKRCSEKNKTLHCSLICRLFRYLSRFAASAPAAAGRRRSSSSSGGGGGGGGLLPIGPGAGARFPFASGCGLGASIDSLAKRKLGNNHF